MFPLVREISRLPLGLRPPNKRDQIYTGEKVRTGPKVQLQLRALCSALRGRQNVHGHGGRFLPNATLTRARKKSLPLSLSLST
jgi:hypothetical protein